MNDEIRFSDDLTFDQYKNSVGENITLLIRDQDILLTAKMLAKLYGVDISTVRKQLKDIFGQKVLNKKSVSEVIAHRAADGKLYDTRYYDQNVIVELGLHLHSDEAKALRFWLDNRLKLK
ncbi:hypothetical protein FWF48_04355 [Candidatus Saccharibacteria bacterium]|nr:hypothetical protein [Candidatus Saccharibacteria bacterium]